jgi:hypothetical protein
MKVNWNAIAHLGVRVVSVIAPQVGLVQMLGPLLGGLTGPQKQNTVLQAVQQQVAAAFADLDPTLLFNPRVVTAIRAVIDSIVALQQTIATELAKAGALPAFPPSTPDAS